MCFRLGEIRGGQASRFTPKKKHMSSSTIPDRYPEVLAQIKAQVKASQQKAAMAVNSRLIHLYWAIGHKILFQQGEEGWGTKVIEQLSKDLSASFPKMRGFSLRNLAYMRKFAAVWPMGLLVKLVHAKNEKESNSLILQQAAAELRATGVERFMGELGPKSPLPDFLQHSAAELKNPESLEQILPFESFESLPIARIPWSHHMVLIDKTDSVKTRWLYCNRIVENNWTRKVLLNQLDRRYHLQQGALQNNFKRTLPAPLSELVRDTFKEPYFFEFLNLSDEAHEKDIEDKLVEQITQFLLELGAGFAFLGRQYRLEVGGKEYFLDLLFYHTRLKCYIVIELKIGELTPAHVGQVQFYLAALDDLVRSENDQPSIGLILVKESNRVTAEYALRNSRRPIGVAEYSFVDKLPEKLRDILPSTKEIEDQLSAKR